MPVGTLHCKFVPNLYSLIPQTTFHVENLIFMLKTKQNFSQVLRDMETDALALQAITANLCRPVIWFCALKNIDNDAATHNLVPLSLWSTVDHNVSLWNPDTQTSLYIILSLNEMLDHFFLSAITIATTNPSNITDVSSFLNDPNVRFLLVYVVKYIALTFSG